MAATAVLTQPKGMAPGKFEAELTSLDAGVVKDIPAKTSLTINGNAMTGAQIDTQIKTYLATFAAADTAKQQYQSAVKDRLAITVEARDFYLQVKKAVVAFFGAQSAQLADFGLTPAKAKAPKTSAQKLVTAAKAKLTRAARGTTSKKKKAGINPTVGTPMVAVGAAGQSVVAPTVVNPALPATSASGSGSGSTPQSSAGGSTSNGVSAPVVPAGSGAASGA
jgi:hypothetical protein